MLAYIGRRFLFMVISLLILSFVSFVIIELPPGDYVEMYVKRLETSGTKVDESLIINMKRMYGLDKPFMARYANWITSIVLHGDFGVSINWRG